MKIDIKRWLIAGTLGFIFTFGYEYVVHGILLVDIYSTTPGLWRSEEDMANYIVFMTVVQFLTSFVLAFIYAQNHEGKGLIEGIRFGAMFGILFALQSAAPYAWMPISLSLASLWALTGFTKLLALGILFNLSHGKNA
ncbi:MAG: hypothetical protein GC137_10175 [Alphaproteobacteria bacterium]|nr:hypothetical protein [Alphaproteobacteria bacterium]